VRVPGVGPAPDLVGRDFRPTEPNRLLVADLTEVLTSSTIVLPPTKPSGSISSRTRTPGSRGSALSSR
jgi:hypothetical protein